MTSRTESATSVYNAVARTVGKEKGNSLIDNARLLAQLSQLAASEGQNACVFKDGGQKVFTTERGRERGRRAVGR